MGSPTQFFSFPPIGLEPGGGSGGFPTYPLQELRTSSNPNPNRAEPKHQLRIASDFGLSIPKTSGDRSPPPGRLVLSPFSFDSKGEGARFNLFNGF